MKTVTRPDSRTRGQTVKRAILTTAATASVVTPMLLAGTPAEALPYRVGYTVSVGGVNKTYGTTDVRSGSNGNRVICINDRWGDPASLPAPSARGGDPQMAYLINKYVNATDATTAAALAYIVKEKLDPSPEWDTMKARLPAATNTQVQARVAQLRSEATRLAGKYTLSPDLVGKPDRSGSVNNVGVKTGSGNWYPGVKITLTLTGDAVFAANNAKTITVTSTTAPQSLPIRATGTTPVKVSAKTDATTLLPETYNFYNTPATNKQDMVSKVNGFQAIEGSDPVAWAPIVTPQLSSNTSYKYVRPGAGQLWDTVTVSGGIPGGTATVKTTVYGPLASAPASASAAAPAGTPVFETLSKNVTLNASGGATVTFNTSKAPTAAGYYVFQESISGPGMDPVTSTYGRASETSTSYTPQIATQVSDQSAALGDTITDTVTISGIKPIGSVDVAFSGKLLGPVVPAAGEKCDAVSAAQWAAAPTAKTIPSTAVTKDGTFSGLGAHKVTRGGCYTYTETLTVTDRGPATPRVSTFTHAPGQVSQTTMVIAPKVGTIAKADVLVAGQPTTDDIMVTGTHGQEGVITGALYGPLAPNAAGTCEALDWSKAEKLSDIEAIDIKGDGTYHSQAIATKGAGCYSYTETLTMKSPDVPAFEHPLGVESQTLLFAAPETPPAPPVETPPAPPVETPPAPPAPPAPAPDNGAGAVDAGGGQIDSGEVGVPAAAGIGAALAALAAGAGAFLLGKRRRNGESD